MGLFGETKPQKPLGGSPSAGGASPHGLQTSQIRSPSTIIGPSLEITGEMTCDEDVVIEGRFSGKLSSSSKIIVGKTGVVEAEMTAAIIQINGRVKGNLQARQKIEIIASGYLEGNILTPRVIVAEGAIFKGNVEMPAEPTSLRVEASPAPLAAAAAGAGLHPKK